MILAALMSRHQSEVATWGRLVQYSALLCTVQGTVQGTVGGYCSWTLFMNTVHRDLPKKKKKKKKKKMYKIFKNFLVYDFLYVIFILQNLYVP